MPSAVSTRRSRTQLDESVVKRLAVDVERSPPKSDADMKTPPWKAAFNSNRIWILPVASGDPRLGIAPQVAENQPEGPDVDGLLHRLRTQQAQSFAIVRHGPQRICILAAEPVYL